MKTSVIIPTLDRQSRVKQLLENLLESSMLPDEICVVEQGNIEETRTVCERFSDRGVVIRVIYEQEKSVAIARNRGAEESDGQLLVFLDDDMTIGHTYIEEAVRYFTSRPEVRGACGSYMSDAPAWTIKRVVGVFFCIYSWRARNIVLPSGSYDYVRGKNLREEQSVQWLYGGNMILRRTVFEEGHRFNTHFKRWAFGEDVMLTYRLYKEKPGSLKYVPELEVVHLEGGEHKLLNLEALRMKIVYRFIFWRKEVWGGSGIRLLAYMWSQIGLSGLELLQYPTLGTFLTLIESYGYVMQNARAIANERIDYNQFIFAK